MMSSRSPQSFEKEFFLLIFAFCHFICILFIISRSILRDIRKIPEDKKKILDQKDNEYLEEWEHFINSYHD